MRLGLQTKWAPADDSGLHRPNRRARIPSLLWLETPFYLTSHY